PTRRRLAALVACVCLCFSACAPESGDPRTFCRARPIGAAGGPMKLEPVWRDSAGQLHSLHDERPRLVLDDRGRAVVLVSVRATNLDGCVVSVSARVAADAQQPGLRGGALLELTEYAGWGYPDGANLLNFASLPLQANQSYALTVVAQDAKGSWACAREVFRPTD